MQPNLSQVLSKRLFNLFKRAEWNNVPVGRYYGDICKVFQLVLLPEENTRKSARNLLAIGRFNPTQMKRLSFLADNLDLHIKITLENRQQRGKSHADRTQKDNWKIGSYKEPPPDPASKYLVKGRGKPATFDGKAIE